MKSIDRQTILEILKPTLLKIFITLVLLLPPLATFIATDYCLGFLAFRDIRTDHIFIHCANSELLVFIAGWVEMVLIPSKVLMYPFVGRHMSGAINIIAVFICHIVLVYGLLSLYFFIRNKENPSFNKKKALKTLLRIYAALLFLSLVIAWVLT